MSPKIKNTIKTVTYNLFAVNYVKKESKDKILENLLDVMRANLINCKGLKIKIRAANNV